MELGRGQLKHEIIRESLEVTLDRLDEGSGFHVVKIRKILWANRCGSSRISEAGSAL